MNQIVIQLGRAVTPALEPYVSISLRKPRIFGNEAMPFGCSTDEAVFQALRNSRENVVKDAGARLFEALMDNPHIKPHLTTALQAAVGTRHAIAIEIATKFGAEALPWEALCSTTGEFLGLDERWALARMVEPMTEAVPYYSFTPPIRVAAVLSCLGIPAASELDSLRKALREAGDGKTELLVVASEEQLFLALEAEMRAGTAPEVTQLMIMPDDLAGLHKLISDFGPHLLHFFCHGSLEGSPHILVAKKEDWDTLAGVSSITAEAGEFAGFTRRTESPPWLVVLNCCEGAGAGSAADSQSLALSLASNGIAAAVVGMREPVLDTTANKLTEALYKNLLADVVELIDTPSKAPRTLDWPRHVAAARDSLAQVPGKSRSEAAASTTEWTMPVLYVRPEDFKLQVKRTRPRPVVRGIDVSGPSPEEQEAARAAQLEITALRALLAELPADQAGPLKSDAVARIAELNKKLGVDPSLTDSQS
ncbi:MAG: CHAT domain-containing protein [Mycobacterium sp.]